MSSCFCIWGNLGDGKSLYAIKKIEDYINKGLTVATNLNLYPKYFPTLNHYNYDIYRIPDKPVLKDLEALPLGNKTFYPNQIKDMSKNGLLVLDELAMWMNTRDSRDPNRKVVIDWFRMARKFGWNLFLIIQDPEAMDKQLRESLIGQYIRVRNLKGIKLPVVGNFLPFLRFKQIHSATYRLGGFKTNSPKVDSEIFKAKDLYKCYDTTQVFIPREDSPFNTHKLPTPRFKNKRFRRMIMLKLKQWKNLSFVIPLALSFFISGYSLKNSQLEYREYQLTKTQLEKDFQTLQDDFIHTKQTQPTYTLSPDIYIDKVFYYSEDPSTIHYQFRVYYNHQVLSLDHNWLLEPISFCLAKISHKNYSGSFDHKAPYYVGCIGQATGNYPKIIEPFKVSTSTLSKETS